jgi:hypothetical protein
MWGTDWMKLAQDRDRWRVGSCECGNETLGAMKCGEFLDWLKTGQLLKKDSAPLSME